MGYLTETKRYKIPILKGAAPAILYGLLFLLSRDTLLFTTPLLYTVLPIDLKSSGMAVSNLEHGIIRSLVWLSISRICSLYSSGVGV